MESETIYEGIGEVTPIENGNMSLGADKNSQDQGGSPNIQLLFNQGTTGNYIC